MNNRNRHDHKRLFHTSLRRKKALLLFVTYHVLNKMSFNTLTVGESERQIAIRVASYPILDSTTPRRKDDEQFKAKTCAEDREVVSLVVKFHRYIIDVLAGVCIAVRLVEECRSTRK